jgi:class 3 adenylate cyclase
MGRTLRPQGARAEHVRGQAILAMVGSAAQNERESCRGDRVDDNERRNRCSKRPSRDPRANIAAPQRARHGHRHRREPIYMAERIPGARLVELPGLDHLLWLSDVDAIIGEIEEFLTGVRRSAEPDRILATVLFTDIVGATEKAAALGDCRWHDLLDSHHEIVRRELTRFRGHEINTAGDGFLAAFDGPARGIRCARAISDGVQPLGLEIRAGSIPGNAR